MCAFEARRQASPPDGSSPQLVLSRLSSSGSEQTKASEGSFPRSEGISGDSSQVREVPSQNPAYKPAHRHHRLCYESDGSRLTTSSVSRSASSGSNGSEPPKVVNDVSTTARPLVTVMKSVVAMKDWPDDQSEIVNRKAADSSPIGSIGTDTTVSSSTATVSEASKPAGLLEAAFRVRTRQERHLLRSVLGVRIDLDLDPTASSPASSSPVSNSDLAAGFPSSSSIAVTSTPRQSANAASDAASSLSSWASGSSSSLGAKPAGMPLNFRTASSAAC